MPAAGAELRGECGEELQKYEERLRELRLFSRGDRRRRGELSPVPVFKGGYKEGGDLFVQGVLWKMGQWGQGAVGAVELGGVTSGDACSLSLRCSP